jgi:hypothetical protein|tara:strand:- start:288 stop:506 length:219 start_codon:yes stop_codon:yes gene_type:complete
MNKVLLEKLFKMNGLSPTGIVVNEDEKRANTISKFGLNPRISHELSGNAPIAGVSEVNSSITEDTITKFKLK